MKMTDEEFDQWYNDFFNKEKVHFVFSQNVAQFCDLVPMNYDNVYNTGLNATFPILCYYGKRDNGRLLFKTSFQVSQLSLHKIKQFKRTFNYSDVNGFFEKNFPKSTLLKELTLKAEKWISDEILDPVAIQETTYICGTEFIECDKDSSFYGNFTQNDKQGCHLSYRENKGAKQLSSFSINIKPNEWDFPYKVREKIGSLWNKSEEEILKIVEPFGQEILVNACKKRLREELNGYFIPSHSPWKIRLSGNDDDSWTKYFQSEESMMQEVYRLRRVQPINKQIDVIDNGYVFTN